MVTIRNWFTNIEMKLIVKTKLTDVVERKQIVQRKLTAARRIARVTT